MKSIYLHQFAEKLELAGYSRRSVRDYPYEVGRFFAWLEENEEVATVEDITIEHISAWHSHLQYTKTKQGAYRATASVRRMLGAVKTFYTVMAREGLIEQDLSPFMSLPKRKKHLPRNVPSQAEMITLLEFVEPKSPVTVRDRCILELFYATGMRSDELRTLCLDDYDLNEQTILVRGKGSKDRVLPVGGWVEPYIREYLAVSRPALAAKNPEPIEILFVTKNGRQFCVCNIRDMVAKYAKRAGIIHITTHSIRHACATHLLHNGADIRYVQELLGHADLSSTQIYTRIDITDLKAAHKRYHPRERRDDDA